MKIPFSPPDIGENEIAEVIDTLRSGWITTGPKTKRFEREIAAFCGTSRAVCLNSGTAAMELTLRLLGVGEGDEVITSPYTYSASASVVEHVGAKIVLVDIGEDSYEMNYDKLEEAINERTKAIIAVDLAGVVCAYDRIYEIAKAKKPIFRPSNPLQEAIGRVVLIADSAHAFGSIWHGKRSGSIADFTCFSFHAVKNLTTAEGGAVTWLDIKGISNDDLYREYMLLSLHGQSKDALAKSRAGAWEYDILHLGYKCNMTDIAAAIGLAQMRRYPDILRRRKEIIHIYNQALRMEDLQILPHDGSGFSSNGHLYMVRMIGKDESFRNGMITKMEGFGVSTNVHYKPLPMFTAYRKLGFRIEDYPCAFNGYKNEITLPLYSTLKDEEAEYVCETFRNSFNTGN